MPHPEENLTQDSRSSTTSYYRKYAANGSLAKEYTTVGPFSGSVLQKGRSASQKSMKNAAGWRSPTPYWGHEINTRYQTTDYSYQTSNGNKIVGTDHRGYERWIGSTSLPVTTNEEQILINKALAAFKDRVLNLSVTFAERQKTVDMVAKRARQIRDLFMRAEADRKTRWRAPTSVRGWTKEAITRLNQIGGTWLEGRYGWTPLLMDLYGAAKAIEKADNGSYSRYAIRTKAVFKKSLAQISATSGLDGRYYTYPCEVENVLNGELQVMVRLDAKVDLSVYLRLVDTGVLDPELVAWELTPYSFVADWFLGIGEFLEASSAMRGLTYQGGSITRFMYTYETCICRGGPSSSTHMNLKVSGSTNSREVRTFTRSTIPNVPSPKIVLNTGPLSTKHMWDAIALLGQAMGKPMLKRL